MTVSHVRHPLDHVLDSGKGRIVACMRVKSQHAALVGIENLDDGRLELGEIRAEVLLQPFESRKVDLLHLRLEGHRVASGLFRIEATVGNLHYDDGDGLAHRLQKLY